MSDVELYTYSLMFCASPIRKRKKGSIYRNKARLPYVLSSTLPNINVFSHAPNVNQIKGLLKPCPFVGLIIFEVNVLSSIKHLLYMY